MLKAKRISLVLGVGFLLGLTAGCNKCNNTASSTVDNKSLVVNIYKLTGKTNNQTPANLVGSIVFTDSNDGLLIKPNLSNLTPGLHGFHIHMNPSCDAEQKEGKQVLGLAAGGHYDPESTDSHQGPYSQAGHLGDLPVLYVDQAGNANTVTLAPKLTTNNLKNHAVIIHSGADNYSDLPNPLGGGGAREYCGVIQ